MTELTPEEEQDLVALADGRLDPERRAALERRAREDPRLAAAIAHQRAAVAAITGVVQQVSAPLALRAAVERLQTAPPRRTLRRRLGRLAWLAPAAVATAGLLAIVVFRSGGPSVETVVAAALRPPVATVMPIGVESRVLREQVEGVPFPNYAGKFGRRATGQRTDEFDGRPTRT